jgi:glycosyltransferase involved in cell wall biosynthesis/SAM-dependent methyltransferase
LGRVEVGTVIAKNYVAHARVLARSYAEHHPGHRLQVLVIDDFDGYIEPADEPFDVVTPGELEIAGFERMAVLYDVLELSTAVKPWLLRWLLARSDDDVAVYLDPDMRLYAPLDEMFAAVREHGLVLSPHNVDPMPRDGKHPNEQDILVAGAYNLGFIGIGSGAFADTLLSWWAERLETECIVDPARGFFVDQRWIDLVPGMAESFHLLRDRGFNVAYWNLPSREISRDADGAWLAAGVPLRLFHFSGFDRTRPSVLSRHQNRIALADHPDLARLCDLYANELLLQGAEDTRDWPYTYATTASGMALHAVMRTVYRKLVAAGEEVESVFEPEQEQRFVDRLNALAPKEAGGDAGVTTYLHALWEQREDLRRVYPDLAGGDAEGYLGWARVYGRGEVPAALSPASADDRTAAVDVDVEVAVAPQFGVNVAGYLNSELGVGEVARQVIRALDGAGVPVLPVGIRAPRSRQGHAFDHRGTSIGGYTVNLMCVNADALPAFAASMGERFFAQRHSIGWWWWEVSEFPERWMGSFEHVNELWAGSQFVAQALAAVSPVPVIQIPTPVCVEGVPRVQPERFGLPPAFVFLFSYDYASVLARKNPLGCIEAFLRAFPEPGEAVLVLKSINGEHHRTDHQLVQTAARGHRHVVLLDAYLEPVDKDRLVASCDCYVSLHRSEGFGITMAEAMFLGKPVIATAYSGNLDFMTPRNSYLVDCALAPIGPGAEPYPARAQWAEPSLDHAAALMREVYEDRAGSRQRALLGQADIRRTHSVAAAGAKMVQRLNTIAGRGELAGSGREAHAALELAARAEHDLRAGVPRLGGRARRLGRRAALALTRPYADHRVSVDSDVVGALQALGRDVRDLGDRGVEVEAIALRGLRDIEHRMRALVEPELAAGVARMDDLARQLDALGEHAALDARTDDLAGQVDALRRTLERHSSLLSISGLPEQPDAGAYPLAPDQPWSGEYNAAHEAFVGRALDDTALIEAFRTGAALPDGYGAGFDERVVEFPWLAARRLGGAVLDAGSTLNHLHVLRRLRPRMDDLHIVTLAPEDRAFPSLGVSYMFADLRSLPLRDDVYDRVLSVSTLEHVGLDLAHFGANGGTPHDPESAMLAAVDELRRVVRPGGDLLVTVPVGLGERFDWVRSLSLDELDVLVARFEPVHVDVTYFRHDGGWRRVERADVAGARYRDHLSGAQPRGGIVAAEAVACVALTVA